SLHRHHHLPDLHPFPTRRSSDLEPKPPTKKAEPAQSEESTPAATDGNLLPNGGFESGDDSPAAWQSIDGLSSFWVDDQDPNHGKDRKSTRLNSSHSQISYAVFCL